MVLMARPLRLIRGGWLVLGLVVAIAPAGAAPDPYREYSETYRCPLIDRLRRVYEAGDPAVDRDRYVAVTLLEHKHGYVQCLFHDTETRILCEAASGFFYTKRGEPRTMRLPPEKVDALARLGFSGDDSGGNFSLDAAVPPPPDFGAIADLVLKALYDGYDARADKTLTFDAPLAPGPTPGCAVVG